MTRLRGIIQDRLVHPNHLTLTLPRLQANQTQSTPIIADLGQRAVEAVRDGLSKAAADFISLESPTRASTTSTDVLDQGLEPQLPPSPPASPPPPIGSVAGRQPKRIPMPVGFPGYSSNAMNTPITPTPGRTLQQPQTPNPYPSQRPISGAHASSYRAPGLAVPQTARTSGSMASSMGQGSSANSNQFRFRGQFASQPPTPGAGYSDRDQGGRVGALNSRAS
jgi:maintenance of morphology protein 1